MDEHLFIVTYDISDPKRWRAVFSLMNGYGDYLLKPLTIKIMCVTMGL
jgi:hypothetical protein